MGPFNAQTELLWVCLAAMAVHYKQLDAAQVAFAALRQTDKILFIDAIKVKCSFGCNFCFFEYLHAATRIFRK